MLKPNIVDGKLKGHILEAYGAVPEAGLKRGQRVEFEIKAGIYTPLSLKTSDSFEVVFTNNAKEEINYVQRAMSVTMKHGKDVGPI